MKEEPLKITPIDIKDASLKFKFYLNKIANQSSSQSSSVQQKVCHLAAQNFLKFSDNQQFVKQNYEKIRTLTLDKKSYSLLYMVDILLKNNKYFMSMVKKDLQPMFKAVWQKVHSEQKKQSKVINMKVMVKTWGILYLKRINIQQNLKKWLMEKYETNLNLPQKLQNLFEECYQKQKNDNDYKLQQLLNELSKQQPQKKTNSSFNDLKLKIFQD